MFFNQNKDYALEQQSIKNERALEELLIRITVLDKEVKALMEELKVTPEQIASFISNKENFTTENWEELQKQQRILDQKLTMEKENIRNPKRVKKTQEDRNVQRHWLFVK